MPKIDFLAMRRRLLACWVLLAACALMFAVENPATAQQQITVQAPFQAVSESFFERIGFGGSFRGPGFSLNLGGFGASVPPFGRFQPGAGLTGGFGFGLGGGFGGSFNFAAGQGVRRTVVSQTPVLTMMNGRPGFVGDASMSPFVVGVVPNVGGLPWKQQLDGVIPKQERREPKVMDVRRPPENLTWREKLNRQAGGGDATDPATLSVAEIRRRREAGQAAQQGEALAKFQSGQQAESKGKAGVARVYYQMAARKATGELKQRIEARLQALAK